MKYLYWLIGILVAIPVLIFGTIYGASEAGGEVVTLERANADGTTSGVRLWVVDQNDATWIQHGDANAHWIQQLPAVITVTRDGQTNTYMGVPDPEACETYYALRAEKYSWADDLIAVFGAGRDAACTDVPVRLDPL